MGFIQKPQLLDLAEQLKSSAYGQYLLQISDESILDTIL
jgi:dTDP-glucose pyrophosphorylase